MPLVRVLLHQLTINGKIFEEGEVLDTDDESVLALANGETLLGQLVAELVSEDPPSEDPPSKPKPKPKPSK